MRNADLLQIADIYQKADHWHPAFRPSGVKNSDVTEVTKTDEDVLILNVPDDVTSSGTLNVLERTAVAVDSEKWCGDERTKYAVLKVEAASFVLAVICVALALVLGA